MTKEQVLLRQPAESELLDFPALFDIGFDQVTLSYHFQPGDERDGVTALIPLSIVTAVKPERFEWLVPGLLQEKTTFLIKGLPKRLRKQLIPISTTVDRILDGLVLYRGSYYRELSAALFKMFKISIRRDDWPQPLPPHLLMRFTLLDHDGAELFSGRDLSLLKSRFTAPERAQLNYTLWPEDQNLVSALERKIFRSWNFDFDTEGDSALFKFRQTSGFLFAAVRKQRAQQGVCHCLRGYAGGSTFN